MTTIVIKYNQQLFLKVGCFLLMPELLQQTYRLLDWAQMLESPGLLNLVNRAGRKILCFCHQFTWYSDFSYFPSLEAMEEKIFKPILAILAHHGTASPALLSSIISSYPSLLRNSTFSHFWSYACPDNCIISFCPFRFLQISPKFFCKANLFSVVAFL